MVAVCEIEDQHVVNALVEFLREAFVRDEIRAHFRLKVVSGDFGRGDDDAGFAFDGRFQLGVEKEGDVRILFRFRNVQLLHAQRGNILRQGIVDLVGRESHADVFEGGIVHRKADVHGGEKARFALESERGAPSLRL